MPARFQARWASDAERRLYNGANGAVDDRVRDDKMICATSNMAMAERVAAALNFLEPYNDTQLAKMSEAVSR